MQIQALSFWLKHCIWNTIRCVFWSLAKEFFGSTFQAIYALWIDAYMHICLFTRSLAYPLSHSLWWKKVRENRKFYQKFYIHYEIDVVFCGLLSLSSLSFLLVYVLRTIQSFFFSHDKNFYQKVLENVRWNPFSYIYTHPKDFISCSARSFSVHIYYNESVKVVSVIKVPEV